MAAPSTDEILRETIQRLASENRELRNENARLNSLINLPKTDDFFESVRLEAAHQIDRWGVKHDDGKEPQDWFWLLGYLAGKALSKPEKRLHHIVSSAAALLNWYRNETGVDSDMRPGIKTPE